MASFRFAWISGIAALCLLTLLAIGVELEPDGLFGLGRGPALVVGIWGIGLAWIGLVVLHERATRRRLVRGARREAEREVTQRTADIAAQELAQPLTVVLAYAQWLQRSCLSPSEQRYYLEQMVAACHEMSVILRELYETIRHSRAQVGLNVVDELVPGSDHDGAEAAEALPGDSALATHNGAGPISSGRPPSLVPR